MERYLDDIFRSILLLIGVSLQKTESIGFPLTCYFHIFCSQLISKTFISPTVRLEQHLMWDDIAILTRYLLMLSFNDCLDGRELLLIKKTACLTLLRAIFNWICKAIQNYIGFTLLLNVLGPENKFEKETKRCCGAPSVGEYNGVIKYYQRVVFVNWPP